jgi:hypothetical protein
MLDGEYRDYVGWFGKKGAFMAWDCDFDKRVSRRATQDTLRLLSTFGAQPDERLVFPRRRIADDE